MAVKQGVRSGRRDAFSGKNLTVVHQEVVVGALAVTHSGFGAATHGLGRRELDNPGVVHGAPRNRIRDL